MRTPIDLKATARMKARRGGFSLAESVISTLIVGLLLVTASRSVSTSVLTQTKTADMVKANVLADSFMSEILSLTYMEPGQTASAITRESGESGGSKVAYDDVDDFHGWTEQPPQYRDGTAMANLSTWERRVVVQWVTIGYGGTITVSSSESKIKRIQVVVRANGTDVITRHALVTNP
jgi:type II secretory pathway pseudopilin PulG